MASFCIRTYRLDQGASRDVARSAEKHLLPALRQLPGFLGYRLIETADDRIVSESTWETDEEAIAGNVVESEWVRVEITEYLAGLPDEFIGPEVLVG